MFTTISVLMYFTITMLRAFAECVQQVSPVMLFVENWHYLDSLFNRTARARALSLRHRSFALDTWYFANCGLVTHENYMAAA